VVIIGQDPYHGLNQSNGLCFSVSNKISPPPSLINIFKEIKDDLGIECRTGNLENWANQGVLLLNTILTVRPSHPASHQNKGWEIFTDFIINETSNLKKDLVFLLWGKFAQSKEYLIDHKKHHILKASHPSPYSASNGFFGYKHFSKCNKVLKSISKAEIDWST